MISFWPFDLGSQAGSHDSFTRPRSATKRRMASHIRDASCSGGYRNAEVKWHIQVCKYATNSMSVCHVLG